MHARILKVSSLLAFALMIGGCNGKAASLAVAPWSARLPVGTIQRMTAIVADGNGRSVGIPVRWISRNPLLATVNDSGVVQAVAPGGPVAIVATTSGYGDSAEITVVASSIGSPLRVSTLNPRYFTDDSGRAVYLAGAHTWENFQDVAHNGRLRTFNWSEYLDFLRRRNLNFTELWRWEQAKWTAGFDSVLTYAPLPYLRTGPGNALDGRPRFDLTRFDETYFSRMRERVREAARRGIYVSIMLFDGWSIEKKGIAQGNPWPGHPFNLANNINGIDGDPSGDNQGLETHTLRIPAIVELQDAYVRKVIDAVGDLDNVLYEVSNETTGGAEYVAWQKHIVATVKGYEARKPKHHPVGMAALYPNGHDADLFASDADFVSPAGREGITDTPPATGQKVLLWDTDHLCGNCGDAPWVWKSFTRGVNPIFMDVFDGDYPVPQLPKPDDPRWEAVRRNLGYTVAYATRMNLLYLTPQPDLCSSTYCLANTRKGDGEYLVYLNGEHKVSVDLSRTDGVLSVEWFSPLAARAFPGGRIKGGRAQTFTAPGDAQVLYLRQGN